MSKASSIRELGGRPYARWLSITLILTGGSIVGLISTLQHPDSHPALFAFSVSWILVLVVTAATRDAFLKMDPKHFCFARWEREGLIYRRVGVTAFCWLLLRSPLGWLDPWIKLSAHRSGLDILLGEINFAEGTHLIGGVLTLVLALGCTAAGHAGVGLAFAILTVPMHVYPLMLQRWNRGRILRLTRRMDSLAQPARRGY